MSVVSGLGGDGEAKPRAVGVTVGVPIAADVARLAGVGDAVGLTVGVRVAVTETVGLAVLVAVGLAVIVAAGREIIAVVELAVVVAAGLAEVVAVGVAERRSVADRVALGGGVPVGAAAIGMGVTVPPNAPRARRPAPAAVRGRYEHLLVVRGCRRLRPRSERLPW